MKEEQLGVIDGIHIGNRDCGTPVLWFGVNLLHGGALQVLNWGEAKKLIEESEVHDFLSLNGKPCACEVDGNTIRFKRLLR